MTPSDTPLRRIDYRELFPFLILFRTVPIAISISVVLLGFLGALATPIGWIASEFLFVRNPEVHSAEFREAVARNRSPYLGVFAASDDQRNNVQVLGANLSGPRAVFARIIQPFCALLSRHDRISEFFYWLVGCLWMLVVWSLFGCGIARICLLRLSRDDTAGLDDAFDYALPRFGQCLGAVGLPFLVLLLLTLPGVFIGVLSTFDLGLLVGSLLWGIVLVFGFLAALLLLGLFFAWPLMIASIAAESQSPLDALTRCLSYVYQRPFHYAGYLLVTLLVGGVVWLIAVQVAGTTVSMAAWSASWGMNLFDESRLNTVMQRPMVVDLPPSAMPDDAKLVAPSLLASGLRESAQDQVIVGPGALPADGQQTAAEDSSRAKSVAPPAQHAALQEPLPATGTNPAGADSSPTGEPVADGGVWIPSKARPAPIAARSQLAARSWMLRWGSSLIQLWNSVVWTLAVGFLYGLFWCMAAAIYLLLRRDVDEVEMDELYLDERGHSYSIPVLRTDANGVPQIEPMDGERTQAASEETRA